MLERGVWEYGSIEETIAIYAKQKLARLKRMEVVINAKAATTIANAIVSPTEVKFDDLNKIIQNYTELSFPEIAVERDNTAKKVKKQIIEASKNVLRISKMPSMGDGKRLTRKRDI